MRGLTPILVFVVLLMGVVSTSIAEDEWQVLKASHFLVYYKNTPKDFANTVEETAENYYREIAKNLGFTLYKPWTWDERAKIYIYDSQEDYQASAKAPWSHGTAYAKDKRIETFPMAHGFFDSTLPHELGHILFREFVGVDTDIPAWFEEGVAMYQERARRLGAHTQVKEAIANETFIPLPELHETVLRYGTDPEIVQLFYAESASVVYYMITEMGKTRFVRFCRELEEGKRFEWALKDVYVRFRDLEQLNRSWLNYLEDL